jgi:hypothetical protein
MEITLGFVLFVVISLIIILAVIIDVRDRLKKERARNERILGELHLMENNLTKLILREVHQPPIYHIPDILIEEDEERA